MLYILKNEHPFIIHLQTHIFITYDLVKPSFPIFILPKSLGV